VRDLDIHVEVELVAHVKIRTEAARYAGNHARQGSPTTVHTVGSLTHMIEVLGMCSGRKADARAITQPMDAK
jgi:hypothetical protein